MLNTAHYFDSGLAHLRNGAPCQDYALSGKTLGGWSYGVVCDGCSSSKGSPERGAQHIAQAIAGLLETEPRLSSCFDSRFHRTLLQSMATAVAEGKLEVEDLLSTCLAFCADASTVRLWACGDGAFCYITPEGKLVLHQLEWTGNAPLYPAYHLVPGLMARLTDKESGRALKHTISTWSVNEDNSLELEAIKGQAFDAQYASEGLLIELPVKELWRLGAFSDGIMSFSGAPGAHVAAHILAFPHDRMAHFAAHMRDVLCRLAVRGSVPRDDLAVAVAQF